MSFFDMIGASDVTYIICLLKNSMAVWTYDPMDTTKKMPKKPLFTRGESKKRQFDKATTRHAVLQEGVLNWRNVFSDWNGEVYGSLVLGWNTWLDDEASTFDTDGGWRRRKNLCILLKT